jgi:hypothetical protein
MTNNDKNPKSKLGISNKKIKKFVIVGVLVVLAIGVSLVIFIPNSPTYKLPVSNSPTLSSVPHDSMGMMHIHPHLTLVIDGKKTTVPAQIGIDQSLWNVHVLDHYGMTGMAPIHTHDTSGTIHVESYKDQDYTIGELMEIWGMPFDNYKIQVTADGVAVPDWKDLVFQDGQQIVMNITTK